MRYIHKLAGMTVAAILVLGTAPAHAQANYTDVDCATALLKRPGMKCQKGPEFKGQNGQVMGTYWRAQGRVNDTRGQAVLQYPNSFILQISESVLKSHLRKFYNGPGEKGANWGELSFKNTISYMPFVFEGSKCMMYRKWGPSKATGSKQNPLGFEFVIDGWFCLTSGDFTFEKLEGLVAEFSVSPG